MLTDEYRYKILKALEANPCVSQRDLVKQLDISLGKVNYCLKMLMDVGALKAEGYRSCRRGCAYTVTAKGIRERAEAAARLLASRLSEYEALASEIESLKSEVSLSR